MRVLLDTNILIHREAATVVRRDIGKLFLWLDKLRSDECVHPASLDEINKHRDEGVATTLAIVDGVYQQIKDEEQFISLCRKRSVFTDKELSEQWNYNRNSRPFIVGFLSAYSLPKRPNLKELIDNGVIRSIDQVPRGFERITAEQFRTVLELSKANPRFTVD